MAKKSASIQKMIGIALLVIGAGLAIWGTQLSGSVGSQISQAITGSHTDKVMTLYIAGAASIAVGAFLFFKR